MTATERIHHLTEASVERLYIINDIREYLAAQTVELKKANVVKVIAFGSSVKGYATDDSDIDLCFMVKLDAHVNWEKVLRDQTSLKVQFLSHFPFPPTQIYIGEGKKKRVIHLTIEYVCSPTPPQPYYIDHAISLWQASTS